MATRPGLPEIPEVSSPVRGELTRWRGERYYKISAYDRMDPFLVSVVSYTDLWMYASSKGGLAAGRRDSSYSLFPYETVDKLHHSGGYTGPTTVIRCTRDDGTYVWEPFAPNGRLRYEIERAVYKHALGCELWFEEFNQSLGLVFRYGWRPSKRFGWVRTSEIQNTLEIEAGLAVLDGVRNLLPAGVDQDLQDSASCLVDAYKSAEYDPSTGLALYRLTANIVDRPIASEALRTTVAWQSGFDGATPVLDGSRHEDFIHGRTPPPQTEFNGRRAAFLLCGDVELATGGTSRWHIALDSAVDHIGVARLASLERTDASIESDIRVGRSQLRGLLAGADALQMTGDHLASAHHVSNVLFNVARGGVPPRNYDVERRDLVDFLETRNRHVAERHQNWLSALPDALPHTVLISRAEAESDTSLLRLCYEYLPLVFSRRHGDPSRPWNRFAIVMVNPDNSTSYVFQGNWRDIFQNWEALARSYPELLEPFVAKFVNASTVDGFNPYRITREGIDWEIRDPNDPWSSIGYWGDHQVVYLLKLIDASLAHHPGRLQALLKQDLFSYADVPYDIRPYADIVRNPKDTIEFNRSRQRIINERVEMTGSDGRLVHHNGEVLHVNLAEKLLVPILAKLSNLVPGAGIWMNTMRPEWNDANNALVGNGVSVVTACYLHRHLEVCVRLLEREPQSVRLSAPVARWLDSVAAAVTAHEGASSDARARRAFMDAAGRAFSDYRSVYTKGMGEREDVETSCIVALLRGAAGLIAETIQTNRRDDGLYHAYNILHLGDGEASITRLPLMLEGQVAALSSGLLAPEEAVALLRALRSSDLYRDDQHSYVLYPVKQLPKFADKNRVPDSILQGAPRLKQLLGDGDDSVVARGADGQLRFHADLDNADALKRRLEGFPADEAAAVLSVYEEVFNHKAFTGRSGTMYGYEGIGCIYWHMVAKLLLAVQEVFDAACKTGKDRAVVNSLREHYYDIRAGLGFTKTPDEFGAFPLDPYSHTPGFAGARQPGMTGQVKEEILTRWGELGVYVENGVITFHPVLLRDEEYLTGDALFSYVDVNGKNQSIDLVAGSLAFTFCQVPVVYTRGGDASISVRYTDGRNELVAGNSLPADISALVFTRSAVVERLDVHLPA